MEDNNSENEFLNKEVDDIEDKNKSKKKKKPGIVYLSEIPKYMNCAILKNLLAEYGAIGRVYLQPAKYEKPGKAKVVKIVVNEKKKNKRPPRIFTEGWVEFESKKDAKFVAENINGKPIGTRKGSRFYDILWNIKYLSRFQWIHLSERLAYEKAVHKQRLRTEISQAKRESTFFSYNLDRSKKLKLKEQKGEISNFVMPEIKQRDTEMEIIDKKKKSKKVGDNDRKAFLQSIF